MIICHNDDGIFYRLIIRIRSIPIAKIPTCLFISGKAYRESDASFQMNCRSAVAICIWLSFIKRNKERNLRKMFVYNGILRAINGVIAVSAIQQDVKVKVLKRCYIQIYPANFLSCYEKIIGLQHM